MDGRKESLWWLKDNALFFDGVKYLLTLTCPTELSFSREAAEINLSNLILRQEQRAASSAWIHGQELMTSLKISNLRLVTYTHIDIYTNARVSIL